MQRKMFAGADKLLFQRANELRRQQTFAEEILWNYLKTKPSGFKFRRQHPFSNYILHFYCHALSFVIEVDGSIHDEDDVKKNDELRQKQLEEYGLTILRFTNDELRQQPEKAIKTIKEFIEHKVRQK